MKKFENIAEFEQLLRNELSGHATPPPADVWSHVATSTAQGTSGLSQTFSFFKSATNLLKVSLFAGGLAAIGIVVYNENKPVKDVTPSNPTVLIDSTSSMENNKPLELKIEGTQELTVNKNANELKVPANTSKEPVNQEGVINEDHTILSDDNADEIFLDKRIDPINKEKSPEDQISQKIEVSISNENPCKGETVSFSSTRLGNWYLDGKKLLSNQNTFTYLCSQNGSHLVVFTSEERSIEKTFEVTDNSFEISKQEQVGDKYQFEVEPNHSNINWMLNGEMIAQNAAVLQLELTEVGSYDLVAVPNGLRCAESKTISLLKKPVGSIKTFNTFTPDGDSHNDEYPVEIEGYEEFIIQIFDRNSRMIFYSKDPRNKWNGREFNTGEECKSGEYIARIKYKLIGEKSEVENVRLTLIRP